MPTAKNAYSISNTKVRKLVVDRIMFTADPKLRFYRFSIPGRWLDFQWLSASTSGGVPKRTRSLVDLRSVGRGPRCCLNHQKAVARAPG
jgi:hypothetical protein